MPTNAATRLAVAVLERRADLPISQLEVWQAGGPSNTTLTNIENGRIDKLTPSTAKKLDAGLKWQPGTAMKIWRGNATSDSVVVSNSAGEPVDIDDAEFLSTLADSARSRDAGNESAMIGILSRLSTLLDRREDLSAEVASVRVHFKKPSAEFNEALLGQVRADVERKLSTPPPTASGDEVTRDIDPSALREAAKILARDAPKQATEDMTPEAQLDQPPELSDAQ